MRGHAHRVTHARVHSQLQAKHIITHIHTAKYMRERTHRYRLTIMQKCTSMDTT